jgi:hypothetical protein
MESTDPFEAIERNESSEAMHQRDREVCTPRSCPIPAAAATRRGAAPYGLDGGSPKKPVPPRRQLPPPATGRRESRGDVPESPVAPTHRGVPSNSG